MFASCNSEIGKAQEEAGVNDDDAEAFINNTTQLRIVTTLGANVGALNLVVGDSITLRAALFDLNNNFLEDSPAIWSMSTNTFPAGDLVVAADKKSVVFTPTAIGSLFISGLYDGPGRNLLSDSDSTGQISVTSTQIPGSMLITNGNNQSAVVSNNIGNPLEVKVLDTFAQPIEGVQVLWTVTSGGGSIISTNPSFTNSLGLAQSIVKVGNAVGTSNNIFRASLVSDGTIFADFAASATPAAEDHLVIQTSPLDMYVNTAFGVQPVFELQDSFNNKVDSNNTGTVTITVQTGAGATIGTNTATFVNGRATFTDIGYDTAESPVVLRATYNAMAVDTSNLDISALPPGFCTTNDASFRTSDGGCKDLVSGLVWARATTGIDWYNAIWDTGLTGAAAADADDFGRTNDYDESITSLPCGAANSCDDDLHAIGHVVSTTGYCHELNEGGKSDWRVPKISELVSVGARYMGASPPYFQNFTDTLYYLGSGWGSNSSRLIIQRFNPAATYVSSLKNVASYNLICVRGNRQAPSKVVIVQAPSLITRTQIPTTTLIVAIQDPSGNQVNAEGVTINLATDLGVLGGTTSVQTDKSGRAIFNAFTLDTLGDATVTASTAGLTDASSSIRVADAVHFCSIEDILFFTEEGGCKDLTSRLVWSKPHGAQTWVSVVWDSTVGGASIPEPSDGGRTNDYDGGNDAGGPDTLAAALCHDKVEGGYDDWRMPTASELGTVYSNGSLTHFQAYNWVTYFWASTSNSATNATIVHMSVGSATNNSKTAGVWSGICVREGTP